MNTAEYRFVAMNMLYHSNTTLSLSIESKWIEKKEQLLSLSFACESNKINSKP